MIINWPKNICLENAVQNLNTSTPFDQQRLNTLYSLSRIILTSKEFRHVPEMMAFGLWLKTNHLKKICDHYKYLTKNYPRKAKGCVFHICPTNVSFMALYSWATAFLCGNSSILRLSGKNHKYFEPFWDLCIRHSLNLDSIFITYGHEKEPTEEFSQKCQARIVWGGNETINTIRSIPLNPLASEITFADRFSACAVDSKYFLINKDIREEYTHKFTNDVLRFDQFACSSPKVIFWIGHKEENKKAQDIFWPIAQQKALKIRSIDFPMPRLTQQFYEIATSSATNSKFYDGPIAVNDVNYYSIDSHPGFGYLWQINIESIQDLRNFQHPKNQTLSTIGFNKMDYDQLSSLGWLRIVPCGKALDFSVFWDGLDLIQLLTTQIYIDS